MRTLLILGLCATAMVANARTAKTDTVNRYIINGQTVNNFNGAQLQGKAVISYDVATQNEKNRVVVTHNITTADYEAPAPSIKISRTPDAAADAGMPLIIVDGVESPAPPAPTEIKTIMVYDPDSPEAAKYGKKGKNGVMVITSNDFVVRQSNEGATDDFLGQSNRSTNSLFNSASNTSDDVLEAEEKRMRNWYANPTDDFIVVDGVEGAERPAYDDIAEISICAPGSKEAAAYGEKGKNGVVIIVTDSAKKPNLYFIDGKKSTESEMKALDRDKIKSITMLKGKAAKDYTDDPNVGVVIVTTKK